MHPVERIGATVQRIVYYAGNGCGHHRHHCDDDRNDAGDDKENRGDGYPQDEANGNDEVLCPIRERIPQIGYHVTQIRKKVYRSLPKTGEAVDKPVPQITKKITHTAPIPTERIPIEPAAVPFLLLSGRQSVVVVLN